MALQDDVRTLSNNPTLRDLEPDALRLIAFSAETRILSPGEILFRAGDRSDGGYVVLGGVVALRSDTGPHVLARPPALIGDSALIAETARPCTAVAQEASSVLKISRVLFHRVLSEHPDSAERLRRALSERLLLLRDDLEKYRHALG